ncbi:dephospho-CoA kinase [Hydrogenobacter thermophilus TK-6]|uniref:Dephospho-CoA kinase n=1 Tax=Hydrogenobacter thermophilus (strain DSM 6534 / IAM 12695 / TK-6) TaxID=608538 RepID=D3DII0_HYDTT|nr:hypothetical protein [Hydrogenobacter thermophilus]ADO45558.1 dephospho-CoA kinase [Hydrogenobacter thermophilus TK-6]BAI69632.1 hypothetical protein HTH_1178 [Hydrogenobacter thermophilus TK-6]
MKDWKIYEKKLGELKDYLEKNYATNPDVEVRLLLPYEEGFYHDREVPYILVKYYIDEERFHERKIELFDYYLDKDTKEIINMLTAMIEEFIMEIEQSEYGGG